jgi:RNA ligase (TIGR02306 family)
MRKLASIKRIQEIKLIEGADLICAYRVDGWWIVDQKEKYSVGDLVVYCEIDSFLPHTLVPFLSRGKEPREFEGVKGERLRTIRLKGQISQGLLLPLSILNTVADDCRSFVPPDYWENAAGIRVAHEEDADVTELLGVLKYERPLPAQLAGQAKGNFPSFIPKTDETRIQSLSKDLKRWSDQNLEVEISEKLDGSSMTVFFRNNAMNDADDFIVEFGVCSRNLQLKETEGNSFWGAARKYTLEEKLTALDRNIAIQGELCGVGIQGNKYKLNDIDFYVFTIYDIDKGEYLSSAERLELCEKLGLKHVPVLGTMTLENQTIDSLLQLAENKSQLNVKTEREGLVFKGITDTRVHFKTISNRFLMKFED